MFSDAFKVKVSKDQLFNEVEGKVSPRYLHAGGWDLCVCGQTSVHMVSLMPGHSDSNVLDKLTKKKKRSVKTATKVAFNAAGVERTFLYGVLPPGHTENSPVFTGRLLHNFRKITSEAVCV